MTEKNRKRFIFIMFVSFIAFSLLKITFFPIVKDTPWSSVKGQFLYRGTIYDSKGRVLASNVYIYHAYLDLNFLRLATSKDGIPITLSTLLKNFHLKYNADELYYSKKRFLYLGEFYEKDEIYDKVPNNLMRFVSIHKAIKRISSDAPFLKSILGKYSYGKAYGGVEEYLNKHLSKSDLYLSIDSQLQRKLFEILRKSVRKFRAKAGGIIVMETNTGKLKAMVTTRNWNDLIMGIIEPGSSIKPVVYAIAIENSVVDLGFHHICTGKIKPVKDLNFFIRDISVHGEVDLRKALVVSCNTATVKIAEKIKNKIGIYNYYNWLRKFGFGEKTGVELSGEIKGVLREPSKWSKIDFAEISIGQGIGVTPVQLISAVNVLFNKGVYVKPSIIKTSKVVRRRIIKEKTARYIYEALKEVVEKGTGELAKVPGVEIAGKTGTAQKAPFNAEKRKYYSIFVGNFKIKGRQFTVLVYLDEPSGELYLGGDAAAPVFAEVVNVIKNSFEDKFIVVHKKIIPNFVGLSLKDSLVIGEKLGIKLKIVGTGIVKKQSPLPGKLCKENCRVVLTLSQPNPKSE